ncbi:hypothetical protein OG285_00150 [Streptomyces sp. NBC_01471]
MNLSQPPPTASSRNSDHHLNRDGRGTRRSNHGIRTRSIKSKTDISQDRRTNQSRHIIPMRVGTERVEEENEQVDLPLRDQRTDLLVTTERTITQRSDR